MPGRAPKSAPRNAAPRHKRLEQSLEVTIHVAGAPRAFTHWLAELLDRALNRRAHPPDADAASAPPVPGVLTPREKEIARHVADGLSTAEIAHLLVIEPSTVKTHRRRIYRKLGVRNSNELRQRRDAFTE